MLRPRHFFAASAALLLAAASFHASAQDYKDSSLSPRERAASLLKELTIDEKISMMMDDSPAIPRLGIKRYNWWNEALHGVGRQGFATVFPQSIGMAATWDASLVYNIFSAVSDEARAKYNLIGDGDHLRYQGLTFWTPNVNIFRDPRWGRGQETYGEDPHLTSVLGKAVVEGLQGPSGSRYIKTIACAKHYAVHSGPEWNRHSFDARDIDPRDLWETYLPSFRTLVDANVGQVMCAYNRFEGEPCCSNKRLLNDILRNQWGYDKIVVSDCWAIRDFYNPGAHETHPSKVEASADAVFSGTDLECGSSYAGLPEAYARGLVTEETIDRSLMRLLEARFQLGEIFNDADCPYNSLGEKDICSPEHRQLALEAARKSMTLLKNNGILPLPADAKVAVMGPNANDSIMQWGNYNGFPLHTITILEGVRAFAPDAPYLKGCDYVENKNTRSVFHRLTSAGKQGVNIRYWNNLKHEGDPAAEELLTSPVNKNNGGATVFAPNVDLENFSAILDTEFSPEKSGRYIISMNADRGLKALNIDGKRVLKSYGSNPTQDYTYIIDAEAGRKYDIQLVYSHDRPGPAVLKFDIGEQLDYSTDTDADIVIFAGGISPVLEGEEMPVSVEGFRGGDRETIELPDIQRRLIADLKRKGKKVVFVNCSGSAVAIAPEAEICDAILQAWYPGEAGGQAVAETLWGVNNPAGRLPVTFYASDAQLPDFQDYSMEGRTYRFMTETPLYAFGHGLSYTDFKYSKPKVKTAEDGTVTVAVDVKNTGGMDGDEVVQLYLRRKDDRGINKTLRAFDRIPLKKGEIRTVTFRLGRDAFSWYNPETGGVEFVPGDYELSYGGASDNTQSIPLRIR